jgi:hypothetical protein
MLQLQALPVLEQNKTRGVVRLRGFYISACQLYNHGQLGKPRDGPVMKR